MFFPEIFGSVEVEERRPRTWNEPRRKRLNFVRSHNRNTSSSSDEWALAPPQGQAHPRRFRNDAETWDLRRHEAQDRFFQRQMQQRDMEHGQRIHQIHELYGPPPRRQIHGPPPPPPPPGRIEEIHPRRHDRDDEFFDDFSESDFSDDGFDDHHGGVRHVPLSIERDHDKDRGRVPAIVQLTGKGKKDKKDKKGKGKGKGHKKNSHDSDSDDNMEFAKGVAAGVQLASRSPGHGHGGGSDRGSPRKGRRFDRDDESEDSMRPPRTSRSRGRPFWGM